VWDAVFSQGAYEKTPAMERLGGVSGGFSAEGVGGGLEYFSCYIYKYQMTSAILYLVKEPNGKYKLVINGDDYLINDYEKGLLNTLTIEIKTIEKSRWVFDINDIDIRDINVLIDERYIPRPNIVEFIDEQDRQQQGEKQIKMMKNVGNHLHDILIKYKQIGGSRRRRPSRKYKKSKRVFRKKSRSTRRR